MKLAMVAQHTQTLRVEGTFNVTNVHGSDLSATVDGYLYLDNNPGLHFTIDAHVKLMGNHIEGTPTMVFDDGSTLNLYYEIKQNHDQAIAREKRTTPNRPLVDVLAGVLDSEGDVAPCTVCHV